jgi:hypothetical protein
MAESRASYLLNFLNNLPLPSSSLERLLVIKRIIGEVVSVFSVSLLQLQLPSSMYLSSLVNVNSNRFVVGLWFAAQHAR